VPDLEGIFVTNGTVCGVRVHTDKENSYSYGIARFSMPFPRRWVLMGRAPERGWAQGVLRWPRARHPSGVRGRGGRGCPGRFAPFGPGVSAWGPSVGKRLLVGAIADFLLQELMDFASIYKFRGTGLIIRKGARHPL